MFSAMLMDAYRDERTGIRIAYRTDGHLPNQRRMHFQSRVSTTTVHDLLFADDCAPNPTSEEDMQRSTDLFSTACENFRLVINTQKTVVMHQPPPNTTPPQLHNALQICVNGTQQQVFATPTTDLFRRVFDFSGHFVHVLDSLDTFFYHVHLPYLTICRRFPGLFSSSLPPGNFFNFSEPPFSFSSFFSFSSSSSSSSSSPTVPTTAAQAAVSLITNLDTTTYSTPISSDSVDDDHDYTCPDCDRIFTSHIGLDLAVETIELLLREKYDETENRLGHAQIIQLLKFCLKTYFTFDGTIYEQVKGTPMSSPISGLIAEAVLQRLESLVFRHHRPKFWARYVDDTFVVIERDQVLTFKEQLNAVFPDIQFTMEKEENNQLAFLDVLVCRKDCGGLKTKVSRKATNTTQILNFNSNHPISHKRSCQKVNRQVCDYHRNISLLNIVGKIFARILLNRLRNHLEQGILPESKCGFRCHRGTTDMIFAARQLQEKRQEMRTHLYSTFVNLTKAFDTVNREGLGKIMQKFGCPERFTQMVRQLHDDMMARVTDN
nr:unnamed protein product [Spirometra erinaceieuropaei]